MAERPIPPGPRDADARRPTWLRPGIVLPALAVVLVLAVLFTPQSSVGRVGDERLTTRSTESQGARGIHDLLRRLGWRTERRERPLDEPLGTDAVYLVLDPPVALTAGEVGRLLDAVRAGASLLFVAQRGSALADSLQVRPTIRGGPVVLDTAALGAECDTVSAGGIIDWPGGRPWLYALRRTGPTSFTGDTVFLRVTGTRDRRTSGTADADGDDEARPADDRAIGEPAALGFGLGAGRVVAVSDPDLLRNDVVRVCRWNAAVTIVRMVEWLGERPGRARLRRLVFDEYHQGYGRHASTVRAAGRFLTGTVPGRALFALLGAALVLLAANAVRPLAPRPRARFERRSPLEHVGALARAYEQVRATRTAARRLVRGLRRRHARRAWRHAGDEEFLHFVAARHPSLAADVERVVAATRTSVPPAELVRVGRAIETIERTLLES